MLTNDEKLKLHIVGELYRKQLAILQAAVIAQLPVHLETEGLEHLLNITVSGYERLLPAARVFYAAKQAEGCTPKDRVLLAYPEAELLPSQHQLTPNVAAYYAVQIPGDHGYLGVGVTEEEAWADALTKEQQ